MCPTNRPLMDDLQAMRVALAMVQEPVFIVDTATDRIVDANEAACAALNGRLVNVIGQLWKKTSPRCASVSTQDCNGRWLVAVGAPTGKENPNVPRDHLTGLATREAIWWSAENCEKLGDQSSRALLFIDLDNFKSVNDKFGHLAGDHVLRSDRRANHESHSSPRSCSEIRRRRVRRDRARPATTRH